MRWLFLLFAIAGCFGSSASQAVDAGTCQAADCAALSAPAAVTVRVGNQFALIGWTAPAGNVSSYTVVATPSSGSPLVQQSAQTNLLLTPLSNDTSYQITVAAVVAGGTGPASAPVAATPVTACARTFALYRSFPAGTAPTMVVTADFDNDGHPDLAVTQANGVTVLLNDGLGDFSSRTDHPLATNPGFLVTADFDGDGTPDLAASGTTTTLFLNDGHGGFDAGLDLQFASSVLAAGDLTEDNLPDLAAGSNQSVSIYANTGTGLPDAGQPDAATTYAIDFAPSLMAIADLNGDGIPDLLVMNTQQKGIDILAGLGDGGLAAPVRLDAGVNPSCVVVADFNGDGLQDLAISGTDQALRIQLNTDGGLAGGGSFQALPAFDAGAVPSFLTAADLDFDDVADLIFTSNAANRLGVLLSERDGGFAPPQLFPTGNGPATVVAADVNGDGFLDLAVANTQDGTVGIYLNVCAPP